MDPSKLAALAAGPTGQPQVSQSKPKPPKGKNGNGGGKNPHQQAHGDMDEGDEKEGDEADEMPGEEKYAELMQHLEASAEDVEEQAEGLDSDLLTDPGQAMDDDAKMEVEECLEALPDDLVECMKSELPGISHDDAMKLADHLEDEGMITDGEMVGGFLFRVGQLDASSGGDEHDEDDGDEDDEDMDDEHGGMGADEP